LIGGLVSGREDSSTINFSPQGVQIISDLNDLTDADVVIDCSTSLDLIKIKEKCELIGASLIVASTGKGDFREIFNKSLSIPVLAAPNLSIGIAFLSNLLNYVSEKKLSLKRINIEETHHNKKIDTPSGTALMLKKELKELFNVDEIEIISNRDESSVGTHKINIYLEDEILSLEHKALDRKAFALGALNLIEWIHRKSPGIYSVQDALNN
jgi:4-hydroxy-tetrahydrodipicolinate reductase